MKFTFEWGCEHIRVRRSCIVAFAVLVENADRELIDMPWSQAFQYDRAFGAFLCHCITRFVDTTVVDLKIKMQTLDFQLMSHYLL